MQGALARAKEAHGGQNVLLAGRDSILLKQRDRPLPKAALCPLASAP
jgi:hypothetical protein